MSQPESMMPDFERSPAAGVALGVYQNGHVSMQVTTSEAVLTPFEARCVATALVRAAYAAQGAAKGRPVRHEASDGALADQQAAGGR